MQYFNIKGQENMKCFGWEFIRIKDSASIINVF